MVKTRLSKVLAMLLALTMVLSTMVIDFTAFADNANVAFTVTAKVDDADYNKGETVTVKYYAKADVATNISSYQFTVTKGAGLTLASLTSEAALGGTSEVNLTNGKIAWARNTAETVEIGTQDTLIATATFTAVHDATAQNVAISAEAIEITPQGYDGNVAPSVVPTAVNLWNITVTFSGDTGIKNDVTGTAYVKYGEPGLYASTAYDPAAKYTPVAAEADDTYRLHDENAYWKVGEVFKTAAEIAEMTFTANATAVATTVKQYKITFDAGDGEFVGEAPAAVVVDKDSFLSAATLPGTEKYSAPEGMSWAGYTLNGEVPAQDYKVTSDIELVAIYSHDKFVFTSTIENGTISIEDDTEITHGTDVDFTITAEEGYVVTGVSYTVGESDTPVTLPIGASYKIEGAKVLGDINVEVVIKKYHTVTFKAGTGVETFEDVVYYVKDNETGLFASLSDLQAGTLATVPALEAADGYRLRTAVEGEWNDGVNYVSAADIPNTKFTANATYTAEGIQVWDVTFVVGTNGKWTGVEEGKETEAITITVDTGYVLQESDIPAFAADTGYVFDAWTPEAPLGVEVDEAKTFTATFTNGKYAVTFDAPNGIEVTNKTGLDGENKATFGQDVTFKLNVDGAVVTLNSVSYSIGGVDQGELEATDDVYTIDGDFITGVVQVSFNVTGMHTVTFNAENGTITGTATQYVKTGETLTAGQIPTYKANDYYTFLGWYDGETLVEDLTEVTISGNKTFTAKFVLIKRTITAPEGVTVTYTNGYTDADAVYGTDVVFTVASEGNVILSVSYDNGVDGATAIVPADDVYTIPGTAIKGNITLTATKVAGTLSFITAAQYLVVDDVFDGKKIVFFKTAELDEGKAYKFDGATMFYSSYYQGYVALVADSYTASTAAPKITVADGEAFVVAYDGDINGTETVTAADAGIINDSLHGHRLSALTEAMLFELDVDGNKYVSTADMTPVLIIAVGNSLEQ